MTLYQRLVQVGLDYIPDPIFALMYNVALSGKNKVRGKA